MKEILSDLRERPGILGCMVTTTDGMVVTSNLGGGLDEDAAAALVSSLLRGISGLLEGCGVSHMESLVLRASRGKILVSDLGNSYLVVVTDGHLDLEQGLLDIQSAAQHLQKLGRILA